MITVCHSFDPPKHRQHDVLADMPNDCQVYIPRNFTVLYDEDRSQNHCFSFSLIANRYALCEELVTSLMGIAGYGVSNLGLSKEAALANFFTGLSKEDHLVIESEAQWAVSRLAKRLDQPVDADGCD